MTDLSGALVSLTPIQRIRRVRRLVRELKGQRALIATPPRGFDSLKAADRFTQAARILFDELSVLEETGTLAAVEECFIAIFGEAAAAASLAPSLSGDPR